jgi:integrase
MSPYSTRRRDGGKPARPRSDFPLRIHKGTGYWCKKVRGRVFYFGKVADDPNGAAALDKWLADKDDLLAGHEPSAKVDPNALRIGDLCNQFLAAKEALRDNGELNPRTFWGYHATCAGIVDAFGRDRAVTNLVPDDFRKLRGRLAKTRKAVALGNEIMRVRSVLKFAFDDGLILAPVKLGQAFGKPKPEVVDRQRNEHRAEHGIRMFEAHELRAILAAAGQPLQAMILLAANCGFGQTDLSSLPISAVKLDAGWVDFPRPKTGVRRRIPLWPETVAAIREWIPQRPRSKDPADAKLLFLTCRGARWVKLNATGSPCDALGQEFAKVVAKLELKRSRRSFYALRHGFETVAGETADQIAVDVIMGHKIKGMAANYIERVRDDRLQRVVEHVRQWLFADAPAPDGDTTNDDSNSNTISISNPPEQDAECGSGPVLRLFAG